MYGASALTLPAGQKLALLANVNGVLAEEEYRANPWGSGMSTDSFYDMVLAATGSETEARAKAKARRAAYIREGIEPS